MQFMCIIVNHRHHVQDKKEQQLIVNILSNL